MTQRVQVRAGRSGAGGQPLIGIGVAARRLGVSRQTVWREILAGNLPGIRIRDEWRLEPQALEVYIAAHTVKRARLHVA